MSISATHLIIVNQEFTDRLLMFCLEINRRHREYWTRNGFTHAPCPMMELRPYRDSQRWLTANRGNSVLFFIDTKGGLHQGQVSKVGDIYKPADYRRPAKWPRGNIFAGDFGASALTADGYIRYL